jgi:eukaryotic-like serine/threonine-protein kinase
VEAAIDCRRAGLARPVAEPVLRDLLPSYLPDEPDAGRLAETVITDGLTWATIRFQATSALLARDAGGYVVFDYLLDQVQRAQDAPAVPDVVWERLVVTPDPEDAFGVGVAAYQAGQRSIAERAFLVAADAGNHLAESNLGTLLQQQGRSEEAEGWYRRGGRRRRPLR